MKNLATSSMQVICAAVLLGGAVSVPVEGQAARPVAGRAAVAREIRDSVAAVLRDAIADHAFPGAYVIVGDSRGKLVAAGDGHLDWTPSARPTSHTLWDIASLTKLVATTTALAQLIERGRVALDSPVQRYLPEWTGPGKDRVTIRHLLTHTSGLPSFRPYDQQTHNADSLARLLFETPLERAAADTMIYSDIGAFMMGRVVERVSGERLDRYVRKHILTPLGMRETMFNPPAALLPRIAPTEIDSTRGGLMHGKVHDERAYYLGGIAAHAGLFSSAADLSRFAEMLLHGGVLDGTRVLQRATVHAFTAYADSAHHNRGLGWQKPPAAWAGQHMSSRAFGHTGFTGTSIAVDPDLDLYIVLLSNRVNPTRNNPRIGAVRSRLADAVVRVVRRERQQQSIAGQHGTTP